jgi:hypothetical protein
MKVRLVTAAITGAVVGVSALALEIINVRATSAPHESEYPSIAWKGDVLGLAWMDGRDGNQEIYFRLVDMDQKRVGPAQRITSSNNWDYRPQLVWNGSGFGLLYVHERRVKRDLYFARLNVKGGVETGPVRLVNQHMIEKDTRLAWTGSGYGLVYADYRPGNLEIFYMALNENGGKAGPDVKLTHAQGERFPSGMVFKEGEFALSFLDSREGTRQVYFMLFDVNGNVKAEKLISRLSSDCTPPSLAAGPGGWGIAWCQQEGSSQQVFFTILDEKGMSSVEPRRITEDSSLKSWAEVATLGESYGIAYYAGDRLFRKLYFCAVDINGNIIQEARPLTASRKAEAACPVIRLMPADVNLAIAWVDLGENLNSEICLTWLEFSK